MTDKETIQTLQNALLAAFRWPYQNMMKHVANPSLLERNVCWDDSYRSDVRDMHAGWVVLKKLARKVQP